MIKLQRVQVLYLLLLCLGLFLLAGCARIAETGAGAQQGNYDTGFVPATSGNYDSRDTAIVISKNTETSTITFKNLELGKYYTLNYDGATAYYDKYGQALSLEQVRIGEIVNVDFLHRAKRLDSLRLSSETFVFDWVEQFAMETGSRDMVLNNEVYRMAQDVVVLTEKGIGDRMDINEADVLRVSGHDHMIECIVVERGHGYLRLANDSFFVGGFLEVDHSKIYQVSEDMLLSVPEGTYEVTISNAGCSGTETITVVKDEEYEWDVSEWQGEAKYGVLVFTVSPFNAKVYIDGRRVDTDTEQELTYGIHQMVVVAEGYQTISKYIRVSEEYSNMNITMEWNGGTSESENNISTNQEQTLSGNDVSANQVSSNTISENIISGNTISENMISGNTASESTASGSNTTSGGNTASGGTSSDRMPISASGYKVTIEGPEGVEVFKDGSYIGLAPVSFPKEEGSYVIILRKNGCQTRSYTIMVDDSAKDISYSFSALLPIN
ncbi:MAG: PEGA domain-containing protein [Lachnospiraceae bacterium]|nr:PEGA domain-containing protein [Lachnospiraceae bacterium]